MIIYSKEFFDNNILKISNEIDYIKAIQSKESSYTHKSILKKNRLRNIEVIDRDSLLAKMQINLKDNFLNIIPIPHFVYGFVKGKSYKDYLIPHINNMSKNKYYIRLDIGNFFDSVTVELIKNALSEYLSLNDSHEKDQIILNIADLVTLDGKLPQGAITSPVISNIVFRRLDLRIKKYCDQLNITYTRYADDMLFSSYDNILLKNNLINLVRAVLNDYGFELNFDKTIRTKNFISLNGFVVSDNLSLSRKKLVEIKRILFILEKNKKNKNSLKILEEINSFGKYKKRNKFTSEEALHDYLAGYRSFLISLLPDNDDLWKEKCISTINRIEKAISGSF
ncbi:reverse transcriptase family protein [Bacillus altitudinis]